MQMEDSHLRILAPRALGLTVLLLFSGGQEGRAQGGDPALPGVAVMDFTGLMIGQGGNSVPLGKAVSAMLTTELSGRDGMRVVERTLLQDLLTEQRLALSGRVDESTAIEVGKMADIAVWDVDLYSAEPEAIKNMKCQMTLLEGKVVYRAP